MKAASFHYCNQLRGRSTTTGNENINQVMKVYKASDAECFKVDDGVGSVEYRRTRTLVSHLSCRHSTVVRR